MKKIIDSFDSFSNKKINESTSDSLVNFWDNYLKLVNIIDGILSEYGELPSSYWKDGVTEELDDITSMVRTTKDISDNKQRIIDNFNNLMDGIEGWISSGKSISRYGTISNIDRSLFKS